MYDQFVICGWIVKFRKLNCCAGCGLGVTMIFIYVFQHKKSFCQILNNKS